MVVTRLDGLLPKEDRLIYSSIKPLEQIKVKKMAKINITTLYLLSLISVLICSGCITSTTNMSSNSAGGCSSGNCSNGYGTATYQDGYRYVGYWKNGTRYGQGTEYFPDGDKYVGQFVDNLRHGQGTYTDADGSYHTGQWANNRQHGQGRRSGSDGVTDEGEFIDGNLVSGKTILSGGNVYIGQYARIDGGTVRHGKGTFTWTDGSNYAGDWKKNNRDKGIYTDTNGKRYRQVWKADELISEEEIRSQQHSSPQKSVNKKYTPPSGHRWKKAVD